jgi:hypothetical protein
MNSYLSNVQIVDGENFSFITPPLGVNELGMYNSQNPFVLSQFATVKVLNRVSTPQEELTIERMLNVPASENVCEGIAEVEMLFAPLEGSPKFHVTLDIGAPVKTENAMLFSRHVSFAAIEARGEEAIKTVT